MRKSVKRWLSALALATGALGTTLLLRRRKMMEDKRSHDRRREQRSGADRWARPRMNVTFRAELMPGRSRAERSFRIARLLPSNRVVLEGFTGEHTETEFEPLHLG
jgi:hypothetical protein